MNPHDLDLLELHRALSNRELSAVELLDAVMARAREAEPRVHAYLSFFDGKAREQAKRADERLAKKENVTPLTGIPIALKDNLCVRDHPTTCASKILENFHPPYDATVTAKLDSAGAVFVGKTNMDEFAMGSSTENSAFGPTRNPWNSDCVPGGSSGGSAAAVAAGECAAALGSDTGGSIRQPASLCGVVGMKPTYGLVSRYGLVAFASSLDQIGPLARTCGDAATVLEHIAGHDPKDSTSAKLSLNDLPGRGRDAGGDLKGAVIGLPRDFLGKGTSREVEAATLNAAKLLESLGARIEDVKLPSFDYGISAYYLIASAEASSNLARYDGTRYGARVEDKTTGAMFRATRRAGFGREVKRRIMLGTYALSAGYYDAFYLKAQKVRTLIKRDLDKAFETCRFVLMPTSPTPAFKLGEKTDDPLTMYLSDVYTIPVNLAGIPGLSIPAGFSSDNLPIGVQLLAPPFHDFALLRAGSLLEKALGEKRRAPSIA